MNSFQILFPHGTGIGRKTTAVLTIRMRETDIFRRDLLQVRIRFILPFHTMILIIINPVKKVPKVSPGTVHLLQRAFPWSETGGFRLVRKKKPVMHSGKMLGPERRTILTTFLAMRPQKTADMGLTFHLRYAIVWTLAVYPQSGGSLWIIKMFPTARGKK